MKNEALITLSYFVHHWDFEVIGVGAGFSTGKNLQFECTGAGEFIVQGGSRSLAGKPRGASDFASKGGKASVHVSTGRPHSIKQTVATDLG